MANANGWGDGASNNNIGWGQGADNAIGWGKSHLDSWSGATDIDGGNLPSNSVAPAITGTAQEGQTLTCSTGTWSGSPIYTYQWKRNGNNIGGATSSTYLLVLADVGQNILCTVTATNFVGSATANSNTVVPIAIANLLLDTYTNATVAYSLRKLRTAYSGSAIRVRRSSDNAEQDIAFSGNDLDTASLLTFCGAGNGFVTTWYDQSTNANNSTQATAANQAQVVLNGNLRLDPNNNKVSTQWTTDTYTIGTNITIAQNFLMFAVVNRAATNGVICPLGSTAGFPFIFRWGSTGNIDSQITSGAISHATADTTIGDYVISALRDSSNVVKAWKNTNALSTGTSTGLAALLTRFGTASATPSTGWYQELIYWNTDLESSRSAIETAINTYYSVY